MAHLIPAIFAKGATTAGTMALTKGVTTGMTLGKGVAALTPTTSGIFSAAQPALAGLPSLTPALTQAAPGIFSMAQPALAGLPSITPGIFSQAAPALGGLKSFAPLAQQGSTFAKVAPNLVGQNQILTEFARQGAGNFPKLGELAGKVTELPGVDMSKGLIGNAPKISAPTTVSPTPGLAENIRSVNTALRGPVEMSYAPNAQGLSQNAAALQQAAASTVDPSKGFLSNAVSLAKNPSMQGAMEYIETHPYATAGAAYGLYNLMKPKPKAPPKDVSLIRPYEFERTQSPEAYATSPTADSSERTYFNETFTPLTPYEAPGPEYKRAASGGLMGLAVGGPVEQMAALNAVGANTGYPQAAINTPLYSNPMMQRPEAVNVISPSGDAGVSAYSGEPKFAAGGLSDLGGYSDGGRLLKGPGDGVSDSIPAVIGERQPARLADGEFVVPARIVSELGNGSTEAGARKLYAMMDRVQKARRKTVGKDRVATNTRADKHLPA